MIKTYIVTPFDDDVALIGFNLDLSNYLSPGQVKSQVRTAVGRIMLGDSPVPSGQWEFPPLQFEGNVDDKLIQSFDYAITGRCLGVLSERANAVFNPFLAPRFSTFETLLCGYKLYALRCDYRVDCLNRKESEIAYYRNAKGEIEILDIDEFVFNDTKELHKEGFFCIPETAHTLFCTEGIKDASERNGLKIGFQECRVVSTS